MASDRAAMRDIAAARMRGDLPPEVDAQDSSKLINPHVPEFMSKAPWYVSKGEGPTLSHQRLQMGGELDQSMSALESLYQRGQKSAQTASKFRPGACRNCGAVTHAARDCMERPRKVGAWKTGTNFAADEIAPTVVSAGLKLGWDAKRDRYAGYDAGEQVSRAAEKFTLAEQLRTEQLQAQANKLERERAEARAARRAAKRAKRKGSNVGGGGGEDSTSKKAGEDDATGSELGGETDTDASSFSEGEDEGPGKIVRTVEEELKLGGAAVAPSGGQAQMTGWNMRSRENTAKYLLNLDPDSAFYDPKTRSMRENPFKGTGVDPKGLLYAGDNAAMMTGDTIELKKAELFAWEAYNATGDSNVHLQANPTQTAALRRQAAERQAAVSSLLKQRLENAYGGGGGDASNSLLMPPELRLGQSEAYTEYGADGKPVRQGGEEASNAPPPVPIHVIPLSAVTPCTTFGPEDIFPGNHTSIWGSWYHKRSAAWGYACCHSTVKAAYCTGALGRKAASDADAEALETAAAKKRPRE